MTDQRSPLEFGILRVEKRVCECGHSRAHHYYDNTHRHIHTGQGRCHASQMVSVPMGVTVTMCKCKCFVEANRG